MSLPPATVDPAATTSTLGTTAPASTGTGTTPPDPSGAGSTPITPTGGPTTGTNPPEFVVYEKSFTSDPNWPSELVLDRIKGNWFEWDRRIHFIADQRGFGAYLRGTFPRPDATIHPRAALSWDNNNLALRGFIIEHISDSDYETVSMQDNAHDVYAILRTTHHSQGLYAQIKIINEALTTRFVNATPIGRTIDHIVKLHSRFVKMGPINDDKLLMILLFNALAGDFSRLQTSINDMFTNPSTNSMDVRKRLLLEEQVALDNAATSPTTALAAMTTKPARPVCANCKRATHRTEYCVAAGGQMAGKTVEEARAAQNAARDALKPGGAARSRGNRPAPPVAPTQTQNEVTVNGQCYVLKTATPPPPPDTSNAFAALSMPAYDEEEYMAVLATTDDART